MGINFLGSIIHNNPGVCDSLGLRDACNLLVGHYKNGVGARLARFLTTLCHTTKIFTECGLPYLAGSRVMHEFLIAADSFAGRGMHHWHSDLFKVEARGGVHAFRDVVDCFLADEWTVAEATGDRHRSDLWDARGPARGWPQGGGLDGGNDPAWQCRRNGGDTVGNIIPGAPGVSTRL